jgi:hypothetical protein
MINKTSNGNISLPVHASLQKWLLIILPHLIAIIVVISIVKVSLLLSFFLFLAIIFSCLYFLRLHIWLKSKYSVLMMYQDSRNNWFIKNALEEEKTVDLQAESFVSNYLLILNFADNKKKSYTVIVTPDSVSKDLFRQLRVVLRTQ